MTDFRIGCYRGRVGLAGLLRAAGVNRGDEVLTQAFTCVAVPEGIIAGGGTPRFVDTVEGGVNVDPNLIAKAISSRTKAIVVQHTFGYAGPIDEVLEIARPEGIIVIEDCCHTYETTVHGKAVGQLGAGAFYSLEWGKPLPCGVGGFVAANDDAVQGSLERWHRELRLPSLLRRLRLELQYAAYSIAYRPTTYWTVKTLFHALSRAGAAEGNFSEHGLDAESDEFGLGASPLVERRFRRKLRSIGRVTEHSRHVTEAYRAIDLAAGLHRVAEDSAEGSVLARYPLWSDFKSELLAEAKAANVEMADWYKTPIHPLEGQQQAAANYTTGDCPNAEYACQRIVSLPTNIGVNRRFTAKVRGLLSRDRTAS